MCVGAGVECGDDKLMLTNGKRRDGAVVKLADNDPQAAAAPNENTGPWSEELKERETSSV